MHRIVLFTMLKMSYYFSHIKVGICLLEVDSVCEICWFHTIDALILMVPSSDTNDIKSLLVLLRYKTFNISFRWKVIFFRNIHFGFFTTFLKTGLFCAIFYMLYVHLQLGQNLFQPHKDHQELYSSYVSMPIESNLFCARVGVYNFNIWSCKKKTNILNDYLPFHSKIIQNVILYANSFILISCFS